jgi:hypothetical protein
MCADPRFRVLDVDWRDSRGACWARAEIMRLWRGEPYFLQIDSHHRFARDWDVRLIHHAARTSSRKPLLTTYCPMYEPGLKAALPDEPTQMDFDYFTKEGIPMFKPSEISFGKGPPRPIRARFVSGHFLFTLGSFVQEVPYDPNLYFHGEEITMAIRAYTWGYDLFHPPDVLLWHEYSRDNRRKHWDDHGDSGAVKISWDKRDDFSKSKVCRFLAAPYTGEFACGPFRTAAQYEAYAGISLRYRRLQRHTLNGLEPPCPPGGIEWCEPRKWTVSITLDRRRLSPDTFNRAQYWCLAFHDADGGEIYREDIYPCELSRLIANSRHDIRIEREFESYYVPKSWTVWPMKKDGSWLNKRQGAIEIKSNI